MFSASALTNRLLEVHDKYMGVPAAERQRFSLVGDTSCLVLWQNVALGQPGAEARSRPSQPQKPAVFIDNPYPRSVDEAIAREMRFMTEEAPRQSTFEARDKKYNGAFTRPRAREAFAAYVGHRDWSDQQTQRKWLTCELQKRQGDGDRKGAAEIQQKLRALSGQTERQGGEVMFDCDNYDEARDRTVELVGPVDIATVKLAQPKFGEVGTRNNDGTVPYNGFTAEVPTLDGRGTDEIQWRFDYCGDTKRCHINVKVRPPKLNGNGAGEHYGDKSPQTLDVAFFFPDGEPFYHDALSGISRRLEDAWLTASVDAESGVIYQPRPLLFLPRGQELSQELILH